MRISDGSSDLCSSDLRAPGQRGARAAGAPARRRAPGAAVLARRAPPPAQADGGRLLRPAGAVVPGTRPGPAHRDRKSTRRTPVTNAHLVCRLLLEKKKKQILAN